MSRIEIRIRLLVVHGARSFDGDAFSAALRSEIANHIGPAPGAADVAGRFGAQDRDGSAAPEARPVGDRFETTTAARVAKRLLP
jgi:hypothetical protein